MVSPFDVLKSTAHEVDTIHTPGAYKQDPTLGLGVNHLFLERVSRNFFRNNSQIANQASYDDEGVMLSTDPLSYNIIKKMF